MSLRRRVMGQDDADDIGIPIGVNLFDASMAMVGFWNSSSYGSDNNFRRFVLPFDSRATFVQTGLTAQGSAIRTKLVDQNGVVRWQKNYVTSPSSLKEAALSVETESIKIVSVYANCYTSNLSNVVWMRTA